MGDELSRLSVVDIFSAGTYSCPSGIPLFTCLVPSRANLKCTHFMMCRVEDAIKLLEEVVEIKEEKLGTVHPDVHNDQERLQQLLKDVGRTYIHKTRKLEELLLSARNENHRLK